MTLLDKAVKLFAKFHNKDELSIDRHYLIRSHCPGDLHGMNHIKNLCKNQASAGSFKCKDCWNREYKEEDSK